jgi:hypothetical protein
MPGRNVSDELAQNIYITQPFTSLKYTNLYTIATLAGNFAGYNSTITTSGTSQVATSATIGAYGASVTLNSLTPNKHYLVYIKTNKTSSYGYRYTTPSAGVINVLNASTTTTPNIFLIDFIADGSTELIHVLNNSTAAGSSFSIDSFGVMEENGTNTLLAMMINTNNENRYRFGSGKQEMDNEIAGFGNMNTALFWEYDTRLGRRWNVDPVDQINMSNYSCFGNNPILNVDPFGDKIKLSGSFSFNLRIGITITILRVFGSSELRKMINDVRKDPTVIVITNSENSKSSPYYQNKTIHLLKYRRMYKLQLYPSNKPGNWEEDSEPGSLANEMLHAKEDLKRGTGTTTTTTTTAEQADAEDIVSNERTNDARKVERKKPLKTTTHIAAYFENRRDAKMFKKILKTNQTDPEKAKKLYEKASDKVKQRLTEPIKKNL